MAYLKFADQHLLVKAKAKKLDAHRVEVFDTAVNTSGFLCYHDEKMKHFYGDFSDFTTLYQEKDLSFILSNDGSVYPDAPEVDIEVRASLAEEVSALRESVDEMKAENNGEKIGALQTDVNELKEGMQSINEAMGG